MPRLLTLIAAVLTLGVLASTATASSTNRGLVTAVARWAAHQDGHVTDGRPWSINPHRELVSVSFSLTFEPSGLVGAETMTILAWRTSHEWVASGFPRVSMRNLGSKIAYPLGITPAGSPTLSQ
jgi:hypothetical protein